MFIHSEKVPRVYKISAQILQQVVEESASIKQLCYGNKKHPNVKAIYSLVVKAQQQADHLQELFEQSELLVKEDRLNPWLAKILVTELLWGKKHLVSKCKPVETVLRYESILKSHQNDSPITTETNSKVVKPRYVRVNTLLKPIKEAVEAFRAEGWNLIRCSDKNNYDEYLEKLSTLGENDFMVDIHIPSVLVFPPKTEFFTHEAYKSTKIVLQDKASCLPVHLLNPPSGSVVLDMCAAPGMKATQIAAHINNSGTVYAVERDERRYEILKDLVEQSGATCIQTMNADILNCNHHTFNKVEYILIDPSCSGSGMTDRPDFEKEANVSRLRQLAGFQIKILRHALTKFPDAKRVVYSTCSIYPQENEDVVRQVLETNYNFKIVPAKQYINGGWNNFGSKEFGEFGEYCLYAKPNEDFTNGFFVAVFERLGVGEENLFFNNKVFNEKKKNEYRIKHKLENQNRKSNEGDSNDEETTYNTLDEVDENSTDEAKSEKKIKKKKKSLSEDENQLLEENVNNNDDGKHVKSKKKKKRVAESVNQEALIVPKKRKIQASEESEKTPRETSNENSNQNLKQTKPKKTKKILNGVDKNSIDEAAKSGKKNNKKKQKLLSKGENQQLKENVNNNDGVKDVKSKKKKKRAAESVNQDALIVPKKRKIQASNEDEKTLTKTSNKNSNQNLKQVTPKKTKKVLNGVDKNSIDEVKSEKKIKKQIKKLLSESDNQQIKSNQVKTSNKNSKQNLKQVTPKKTKTLLNGVDKNSTDEVKSEKKIKKKKKLLSKSDNQQLEENVNNNDTSKKTLTKTSNKNSKQNLKKTKLKKTKKAKSTFLK